MYHVKFHIFVYLQFLISFRGFLGPKMGKNRNFPKKGDSNKTKILQTISQKVGFENAFLSVFHRIFRSWVVRILDHPPFHMLFLYFINEIKDFSSRFISVSSKSYLLFDQVLE